MLVSVVIIAFAFGGVTVIEHWWPAFWVCAGIVFLAIPAGKIIGIMNDTVVVQPGPRTRAAVSGRNSATDPGVKLD
ncbi:MAG TPA: hypothetical protein VF838_07545 [Trebonia sp.]